MQRRTAHDIRRAGGWQGGADRVTLDYQARFLRRKTLITDAGAGLFVDLPEAVSLNDGDAFALDGGGHVAVRAAPEPLIEIISPAGEITRLAWHIGNRHMPAQIEPARILIQANQVMADLLARLGAATREVTEPFTPEGGAYGLGRTHGHHHAQDHPHHHADD